MDEIDEIKKTTRSGIAQMLAPKIGSFSDSYRFVSEFFDLLGEQISVNQKVKLHGFGTFQCLNKSERVGRNPKTKEESTITARRVVSFIASDKLKRSIAHHDLIDD